MLRNYFVVSRWWDRVMGGWLWLRGRPRCARSPFEPARTDSERSQDAGASH